MSVTLAFAPTGRLLLAKSTEVDSFLASSESDSDDNDYLKKAIKAFSVSPAAGLFALAAEMSCFYLN